MSMTLNEKLEKLKSKLFSLSLEDYWKVSDIVEYILKNRINSVGVELWGVVENVETDKIVIEGYVNLYKNGDNGIISHFVDLYAVIHYDLTMEFKVGVMRFTHRPTESDIEYMLSVLGIS